MYLFHWLRSMRLSMYRTYSIACYAANEKGFAQGVQEDNNFMEVRNESDKNRKVRKEVAAALEVEVTIIEGSRSR
jgi:hypothetical protein